MREGEAVAATWEQGGRRRGGSAREGNGGVWERSEGTRGSSFIGARARVLDVASILGVRAASGTRSAHHGCARQGAGGARALASCHRAAAAALLGARACARLGQGRGAARLGRDGQLGLGARVGRREGEGAGWAKERSGPQ